MPSFNAINLDMSKFIKEFKEFAVKGNAIDMAVGVIIGAAFGIVIISFGVFLLDKGINVMARKKNEQTQAAPPAPSKEELLLTEIRDILKNK